MGRLLIIGCGGVAGVAIHKCCQNSKTFSEICIASRTKEKCDTLKKKLEATTDTKITTAQVNADKVEELVALIRSYQPDAVLNVALPYQDLTIMEACLECKVDYIDTANYEPEDTDDPEWRANCHLIISFHVHKVEQIPICIQQQVLFRTGDPQL